MDAFEFTIYSVGDAEYLREVFNAVAMLVGTGLPYDLAKVGALFSIIMAAIQGITAGAESIKFQNIIVGFILFSLVFGASATTNIHDVMTDDVYTVDNMPVGIAMAGSFLSGMGYQVTEAMETAFSFPTMLDNGFAAPLQTLLAVRKISLGPAAVGGDPDDPQGDLKLSLDNYVRDCTAIGLQRGDLNNQTIQNSSDPWSSMKFSSSVFGTSIHIPGEEEADLTCSEAYTEINNYINSEDFWDAWSPYLESIFNNADPVSATGYALDKLADEGIDAQKYMLTSVFRDAYENGVAGAQMSSEDWAAAAVTRSAREQRNMQWATEATIFMTVVKPMMTFMESLLYVITPFLGLLLVFIPMGPSMVGKYLLMALWIQLWSPMMAVLNFYINFIISRKFDTLLETSKLTLTSMHGQFLAISEMSDWLGTAGMLASATPALTLSLVYGSAVTATHLAGRMQGGDHINEKMLAPDVMQNAPALNVSGRANQTAVGGLMATGADPTVRTLQLGDNTTQSVQSASQELSSASAGFSQTLGNVLSSGGTLTNGVSKQTAFGQSVMATQSQAREYVQGVTNQVGDALGWDDAKKNEFSTQLAGRLGAGMKGGIIANAQAAAAQSTGHTLTESESQKISNALSESESDKSGAAFQDAMRTDISSGAAQGYINSLSDSDNKTLQEQASKVKSANDTYTEAVNQQKAFGSTNTITTNQINGYMDSNDRKTLAGLVSKYGLENDVQNRAAWYREHVSPNAQQATTMAALDALDNKASNNPSANKDFLKFASGIMGRNNPEFKGALENKGVSGDAKETANQAALDGQGKVPNNQKLEKERAQAKLQGKKLNDVVGSDVKAGSEQVAQHFADGKGGLPKNEQLDGPSASEQAPGIIRDKINQKLENPRTMSEGLQDRLIGGIDAVMDSVGWAESSLMAMDHGIATDGDHDGMTAISASKEEFMKVAQQYKDLQASPRLEHTPKEEKNLYDKMSNAWDKFWTNAHNYVVDHEWAQNAVSVVESAPARAAAFTKEGSEDAKAAYDLNFQGIRDDAFNEAKDKGLTDKQADLYAEARVDGSSRLLAMIGTDDGHIFDLSKDGPLVKFMENTPDFYGKGTGDRTLDRAIIRSAEAHDTHLLGMVGDYNKSLNRVTGEHDNPNQTVAASTARMTQKAANVDSNFGNTGSPTQALTPPGVSPSLVSKPSQVSTSSAVAPQGGSLQGGSASQQTVPTNRETQLEDELRQAKKSSADMTQPGMEGSALFGGKKDPNDTFNADAILDGGGNGGADKGKSAIADMMKDSPQ